MKNLSIALAILLLAVCLSAQETKPTILFPDHHLVLEASGKVFVQADQAVFSFATRGLGPTLREAVRRAKDNVALICGELSALGIDPKSFATASFASGKNPDSFFLTDKKDYSASLTTSVTLRDLSKLDEAILILTDKKAENLSGVQFSMTDLSPARQQAREIALNRIAEQRDTISRILGVKVTDVQLIDEAPYENLPWNTGNYYYGGNLPGSMNTVSAYDKMVDMEAAPSLKSAFFSPEITVETQLRVVYRIGVKE